MAHVAGTKWDVESAKKALESKGLKMVDINEFIDSKHKMTICDVEGFYYYRSLIDVINAYPQKVSKSNPYTIQNIKLWCELNNKLFDLLSTKFINARTKLKWQCFNENCGETFEATWDNIYHNHGCGVCNSKQVGLSNCLATLNPELASEWHPTLNGDLTSYDVTSSSNKDVWWQCLDKPYHIWKTNINNRNIRGDKCPYCSGKLPSKDYNLLIINPKLCEEWDYNKNKNKPEEFLPVSKYEVWWKCNECGHEWETSIRNRKNRGCPECNKSKGEKRCRRVFDLKNIYYIPQKEFDGLLGLGGGNLSYDFYLPKYNLLIEYQGEQHEKPIDFKGNGEKHAIEQFEKQVEHDRRKREYAQNNNIKLLEIWYWDFDNIETILNKELN